MSEYLWALGNGDIVSSDYNRAVDSLSNEQVLAELQAAFQQFGHSILCEPISDQLSEVYSLTFNDASTPKIIICAKGTTPGGRSNLNDEQRTQQKSKYINYAYEKNQMGISAVQLGVYRREGQTVFCAWKLKKSTASPDTPISKQIKISTIAQAMKEGFVQQEKGGGEYACAFRKEFIYFYIKNASWLHGEFVSELAEHTAPLLDEAVVNQESHIFSPEWFREKATEYPTLDKEANDLLIAFQKKFSPEYLSSLNGADILNTIFLNANNPENICRILEFDPQIRDFFGSIKGGNAYKYGLFYSSQGTWMSGSHQKPHQLSEDEAITLGTKYRDRLVAGAKAIKEFGSINTIEDYKKLHSILSSVTEGDIERVWFLKYYQMFFPALFATNYSDYAQRTVLDAIGEEKEKYALVRMGQIRLYADKCGISNVMFNKIFWDNYSEIEAVTVVESAKKIRYATGFESKFARNRIIFGAPGTGKSFQLNKEKETLLSGSGEYERVTFHPDYSYANFVGTYKPVPYKDSNDQDGITYSYVPGPFMRTYIKALENSKSDTPKPYLLIIEEINRANVAAVFGDVFQLLDRGDDETSEYPIQASEDIKKFLSDSLGGYPEDYSEIRIPDNMFIWATMNSADQGVFPMDTAFKRRWDFTYLGIDDNEDGIVGKKIILGKAEHRKEIDWNELRKAINEELLSYKVNEDKLMGPYFISKKTFPEDGNIDPDVFAQVFKNKVIMYLFDDAAKQKRLSLFSGCSDKDKSQYSKICASFDTLGVDIFCEAISSRFIDVLAEDEI